MERIRQAEQLVTLIEAIKSYQRYQANSIKRYNDMALMGLNSEYNLHNAEIQAMVIARLELRYKTLITKMYNNLNNN